MSKLSNLNRPNPVRKALLRYATDFCRCGHYCLSSLAIISSTAMPSFFNHYMLPPSSGRLLPHSGGIWPLPLSAHPAKLSAVVKSSRLRISM